VRRLFTIIPFATAILAAGSWLSAEAATKLPAACTPGKAPIARVTSVVDGATIVLDDGRIVTVAGIDAPLPSLAAPDQPSPIVEAAKAALALSTSGAAAAVKVAVIGDKPDRYGRWRANVFAADGKPLALAAIGEGMARVHRLPGDPACVLALLDAERTARIAARGMWATPDYRIRSALDPGLAAETGLFELVAGRVVSIGHGDAIIFVNFSRDYGEDFTVLMTPAFARTLATAGIEVDALAGKRVLVRGMIEASGGPAIRVADPSDIEILGDGED
jgi:endonuclease YncB( thermonuclease family)